MCIIWQLHTVRAQSMCCPLVIDEVISMRHINPSHHACCSPSPHMCSTSIVFHSHTHTHTHSHSQANENDLKVTIVRELITHDSCLTLPLTYKASDWLISTWLLSHTLTRWKPGQKGVNVGICMHVSMICDFQHDNLLSCLPRQHLTIPECIATHSMESGASISLNTRKYGNWF